MPLHSFDPSVLELPLFEDEHRHLARQIDAWCAAQRHDWQRLQRQPLSDVGRTLITQLADAGWFSHLLAGTGDVHGDLRSLCIRRQALAYGSDLADFAYSIQELTARVIAYHASEAQKRHYLPLFACGQVVGAFATSELAVGSDVGNIGLSAQCQGDHYLLDGDKAWIAQGDLADVCIVIARTGPAPGPLGLSALLVDMRLPGISVTPVQAIAPRSWANIRFDRCRVPVDALIGKQGQGFIIAMQSLDRFRMTVAAAAIGFARKAADFALARASTRRAYKGTLSDLHTVKAQLAGMELKLGASALLTAKAAWTLDAGRPFAKDSAVAKVFSTEAACEVVDQAVQIAGAAGLVHGSVTESLYRQVRSLRLYEGASEVLLMNIATSLDARKAQNAFDPQE
ncbi:acyl-CoA dehydrogenase family protein [Pseudomonas sp. S75]|uniref:acyl-CoA dehydrogenase family protein n=1 Tax=unclassified Pseudomonas TaxID=196821 RepID=UPI00190567BD|nr:MULTISPECIES: acyl-CoA dehydrogenase family protein [unclassified Pseudomonas]MBJ9977635.1 acyl-CoA dehydrogenase family protein [Pseudomonas sp. S30]MBK0155007.1 acyl-CoA dehydrogenase family protein [Pseudomonas sp. S75]